MFNFKTLIIISVSKKSLSLGRNNEAIGFVLELSCDFILLRPNSIYLLIKYNWTCLLMLYILMLLFNILLFQKKYFLEWY